MAFDAEAAKRVVERLPCARAAFWRHQQAIAVKNRSDKSRDAGGSGHSVEHPRDSQPQPPPWPGIRINFSFAVNCGEPFCGACSRSVPRILPSPGEWRGRELCHGGCRRDVSSPAPSSILFVSSMPINFPEDAGETSHADAQYAYFPRCSMANSDHKWSQIALQIIFQGEM